METFLTRTQRYVIYWTSLGCPEEKSTSTLPMGLRSNQCFVLTAAGSGRQHGGERRLSPPGLAKRSPQWTFWIQLKEAHMLLGSNSGKTSLYLTRSPQPPDTRTLSSVLMARMWLWSHIPRGIRSPEPGTRG